MSIAVDGRDVELGPGTRTPGRRLLARVGPVRFAALVGVVSVLLSAAVTALMQALVLGEQSGAGLLVAVGVPALVAPPLAWYLSSMAVEADEGWRVAARLAMIDPLTGTLNRRRFFQLGLDEYSRAAQERDSVAVLLLDLDNFKLVNDLLGHAAGDDLLTRVAEVCKAELREADQLARYGGEEFVVLLPGASVDEARQVGERLRRAVERLQVQPVTGSTGLAATASVGVSVGPSEGDTFDTLVDRADQAMYVAKRNGKNQVALAG
ncbi:MAG: GGDEF domain-containing protein [Nocardioidaceae bacterium]